MSSSMLYTMGMALDRAAENGFGVRLLVEGVWIEGQVAATDGVGVVLETPDARHCVVKTDRIAAVEVHAELPAKTPITMGAEHRPTQPQSGGAARPMPGPRPSYV